jgi:hypothetical protein
MRMFKNSAQCRFYSGFGRELFFGALGKISYTYSVQIVLYCLLYSMSFALLVESADIFHTTVFLICSVIVTMYVHCAVHV